MLNRLASWKWKLAQRLEYRWWRQYLKNKNTDAYLQWKLGYWKELLQTLRPYVPEAVKPARILDAGCGPAGICIALDGYEVDAIDPLLDKYQALAHFQPAWYPWVRFRQMPIEQLEEQPRYDRVYCINAINHVKDIDRCYKALAASLKPGGYILISTDAHRHRFLKKIFQWLPGDVLHPVQLDIKEYEDFLRKNNLEIVTSVLAKRETIFDYYVTVARKP